MQCPLCIKMGEEFVKYAERNPHLMYYVHDWYRRYRSLPKFFRSLSWELCSLKRFNVIYPVGDPIFIHVYKSYRNPYGIYHPIEPELPKEYRDLISKVDELISIHIERKKIPSEVFEDEKERAKFLEGLFNEIVKIGTNDKPKVSRKRLYVSDKLYRALKYTFFKEKIGLGVLEPFIRDPYLEDISCDGVGNIFVYHKIFGALMSTVRFDNDDELNKYIMRLCERIGKPPSVRNPIIDATLPDGSRLNVVFGRDLSRKGTNFTIRKYAKVPLSITQLIKFGTLDPLIAAYLWIMIQYKSNIFICGETASGKTTTLNAISVFIRPDAKVVSIEEVAEVQLPHQNWVSEVTKRSEDGSINIELYDLVKSALRQRPDYIIVGEIRGKEGHAVFQAMQTGHAVMTTFHAGDIKKFILRITGNPINIPETYLDIINVVVFQNMVFVPGMATPKRRVTSINEILGYDPVEKSCNFIEVFHWEPTLDKHVFRGVGNSYLLEERISRFMGLSEDEVREVYNELERRALILKKMVKNNILDYYDVWKVISTIYYMPSEEALRKIDVICSEVKQSV